MLRVSLFGVSSFVIPRIQPLGWELNYKELNYKELNYGPF